MHRLLTTERRGGRVSVVCLSLLLLSFLVLLQSSGAFTGRDSPVLSVSHSAPSGSIHEEILQLGTWDALTLCIKDSKEERALERWLFCVEAVESEQTSGIPLYAHGSEEIKPKNEVSDSCDELSTLVGTKAQEEFLRGRMELDSPNDQLESIDLCETGGSEFQKMQSRKHGSEDGGLGLFKMDDVPRRKGMSSLHGIDRKVSDSRKFDIATLVEVNGNAGFVSGPADANPVAVHDRASDSEGKSREDFLSYRADQNQGSASDSSHEVDHVLAGLNRREGRDDDLQQDAAKHIPVANSVTNEALNSCTSGFLSSLEGLTVEKENVSSSTEQHPHPSLGMRDAFTSAAVVGLFTLMLRSQRGRGGGKSHNQPNISSPSSNASVESNRLHIDRKSSIDTQKLSGPLGMAVAQVLYEVLEQNGDYNEGALSAESLSNLLGSALKESLLPVLGNDRLHFVEKFRDSFSSTYRTRESVRSAYIRAGIGQTEARQVYGMSWRGLQPKSRRESHKELYSHNGERHYDYQDLSKRSVKLGADHKTKTIPVQDEMKVTDSSFKQDTTYFYSTGKPEQDGRSDCGESSTGHCLGGNSLSGTSQLPLSSQEKATSCLEEDCSEDEQMYSADDSSGSEEWIVLERRCSVRLPVGRKESSLDDERCSYYSLDDEQSGKDQGFTTHDRGDMSQTPQPRSCTVGGVGSSMDSHWDGGSVSSQGVATPRLELADRSSDGNYLEPSLRGLIGDSAPYSRIPTTSEDSRASSLRTSERNATTDGRRARGEGLSRRSVSADNCGDSDRMTSPRDGRADGTQSSGLSVQDALVLAGSSSVVGVRAALQERYDLFERSVAAQEHHNRLLAWDIQSRSQGLAIKQEHLHLKFESNSLMKENVELSRMKAEFKENELQDRKLQLAYNEFSRTCADQLVAGLCVMLVVLGFSFWKFSYDRLSGVVTVCQPPVRETHQGGWLGTNWMYNSLNAFTYQLQAFTCEVTKVGRMVVGLVLMALVTSSLLQRSVTSSSQAMPATVILIVLGGICGFAGKLSIDSLGGSGLHWLVLWECLCFLHAVATCFTPILYHLLNGPPPKNYFETASRASRMSSAVARFIFHTILVFILPLMAGLLPFASPEEIMQISLDWWSPGTFHGKYRVHI